MINRICSFFQFSHLTDKMALCPATRLRTFDSLSTSATGEHVSAIWEIDGTSSEVERPMFSKTGSTRCSLKLQKPCEVRHVCIYSPNPVSGRFIVVITCKDGKVIKQGPFSAFEESPGWAVVNIPEGIITSRIAICPFRYEPFDMTGKVCLTLGRDSENKKDIIETGHIGYIYPILRGIGNKIITNTLHVLPPEKEDSNYRDNDYNGTIDEFLRNFPPDEVVTTLDGAEIHYHSFIIEERTKKFDAIQTFKRECENSNCIIVVLVLHYLYTGDIINLVQWGFDLGSKELSEKLCNKDKKFKLASKLYSLLSDGDDNDNNDNDGIKLDGPIRVQPLMAYYQSFLPMYKFAISTGTLSLINAVQDIFCMSLFQVNREALKKQVPQIMEHAFSATFIKDDLSFPRMVLICLLVALGKDVGELSFKADELMERIKGKALKNDEVDIISCAKLYRDTLPKLNRNLSIGGENEYLRTGASVEMSQFVLEPLLCHNKKINTSGKITKVNHNKLYLEGIPGRTSINIGETELLDYELA